jgi:hypothetical protein
MKSWVWGSISLLLFVTLVHAGQGPKLPKLTHVTPASPASLEFEQCGCPSGPIGTPTCALERQWSVRQTHHGENESIASQTSVQSPVVRGSYVLRVINSGSPTALTSVYVALEASAPIKGNAPGPSGKNWKTIAVATQSAGPQCGTSATLCSVGDKNYTAKTTAGSSIHVLDAVGDSIVIGGEGQAFPVHGAVDLDSDGHFNEDSPDVDPVTGGPCPGTNLTLDEDSDLKFNEDGICDDIVTFTLVYAFSITEHQRRQLVNQSVRISILTTFLAKANRSGVACAADVNCDGILSVAEQTTRTVQAHQGFTFPSDCLLRCPSAYVYDDVVISVYGPGGEIVTDANNLPLNVPVSQEFPSTSEATNFTLVSNPQCNRESTLATTISITHTAGLLSEQPEECDGLLSSPSSIVQTVTCPQAIGPVF